MPNWVITMVNFQGNQKDIDEVFKEISNKDSDDCDDIFDFNKLIPMPEDFNGIESGLRANLAYDYYIAKISKEPPKDSFCDVIKSVEEGESSDYPQEMYELGKRLSSNKINYGCKDWYDWRISNWGTNRNAYNCNASDSMLCFETAWSFPQPIMHKLSEVCSLHHVKIYGKWADEDMGVNTGYFESTEDGTFFYQYYDDYSDGALKAYVETHGDSDCIGTDPDGNYIKYECETCPNRNGCVWW